MRWYFRQLLPATILTTLATSMYLYVTQFSELTVIGGFTLHITDVLFAVIMLYCISGALSRWYYSPLELALLVLCSLLIFSFGRGVVALGAAASGAQFRASFAGFISFVAFVYFWGRDLNADWVFNKIVLLGWGIVVLSGARLVLGLDAFILEQLDPLYEFRTLNGAAALMLGEAALIAFNQSLSATRVGQRWLKWITFVVFVITLLISDQRTAIFATVVGIAVIGTFIPRQYRAAILLVGSILCISGLIIFCAGWIESSGDITEYLPNAVSLVLRAEGTFGWRIAQWEHYLYVYSQGSLLDQMIGQPLGMVTRSAEKNSSLSVMAHNEYVQLLLTAGVVGTVLFLVVLTHAVIKCVALLRNTYCPNAQSRLRLSVAIIASHAVFSVGYVLPNEQGLLLAIALQLCTAKRYAGPRAHAGELGRQTRIQVVRKPAASS
jgi:O-antigen ligase